MRTLIAFMNNDNHLNLVINTTKEIRQISTAEEIEEIIIPPLTTVELMAKDYPWVIDYCEIEVASLPTLFKSAWIKAGDTVVVDMGKAQVSQMNDIRIVRNNELSKKDKEIYLAEDKADTNLITTLRDERQILRDIPQTFDLSTATNPEELYALWPSVLPERTE